MTLIFRIRTRTPSGIETIRPRADAPDLTPTLPGTVRSYALMHGRMTLVAELRDSTSDEPLARAYNEREDMRDTRWEWTTLVTNAEARWRSGRCAT